MPSVNECGAPLDEAMRRSRAQRHGLRLRQRLFWSGFQAKAGPPGLAQDDGLSSCNGPEPVRLHHEEAHARMDIVASGLSVSRSGWTAIHEPLRPRTITPQRRQLPKPRRAEPLPEPSHALAASHCAVEEKGDIVGSIVVIDQFGDERGFRVRWSRPLRKLMARYCSERGLRPNEVQFYFGGELLEPHHTPAQHHME